MALSGTSSSACGDWAHSIVRFLGLSVAEGRTRSSLYSRPLVTAASHQTEVFRAARPARIGARSPAEFGGHFRGVSRTRPRPVSIGATLTASELAVASDVSARYGLTAACRPRGLMMVRTDRESRRGAAGTPDVVDRNQHLVARSRALTMLLVALPVVMVVGVFGREPTAA